MAEAPSAPAGSSSPSPQVSAARRPTAPLSHRDVLTIALPIVLSNATVPLIGFVDTAVIGQLGAPHLMGAVAIGALIFNMIYWTFGFLRMGTTGLVAQANGADDHREIAGHLLRAMLFAISIGIAIVVLQQPLATVSFWITGGSPEVVAAGRAYFDLRVWAAPAGLINYVILGWLIGLGRAGVAFVLQLLLNLLNMALAVGFTLGLDWGIAGVGWAALIAEITAALAGLVVTWSIARTMGARAPLSDAIDAAKLARSLAINTDITIRTLANFVVLVMFTSQGAAAGDVTLAANALLINIKNIVIYLLDGFAFAAEALVGRAIGARDRAGFRRAVKLTSTWAAVFAVLVAALVWFAGPWVIGLSTNSAAVQATAATFLAWAALSPLIGVWCFQLDGIFIGATRTRDMRNMMLLSLVVFLVAFALLTPWFGIHGLWVAYLIFYAVRGVTLATRFNALEQAIFPPTPPSVAATAAAPTTRQSNMIT